MPIGPGKYDPECMALMKQLEAIGIILVVVGGKAGTGFSMTTKDPALAFILPSILRDMANQMDADMRTQNS